MMDIQEQHLKLCTIVGLLISSSNASQLIHGEIFTFWITTQNLESFNELT